MKRVDEYHLTGIALDMFVRWEHRPPSSTEGRGENRNEARGESKPKPEQNKSEDTHYSEGLVSHYSTHSYQSRGSLDSDFMSYFYEGQC